MLKYNCIMCGKPKAILQGAACKKCLSEMEVAADKHTKEFGQIS